jgi:hypothetical protein
LRSLSHLSSRQTYPLPSPWHPCCIRGRVSQLPSLSKGCGMCSVGCKRQPTDVLTARCPANPWHVALAPDGTPPPRYPDAGTQLGPALARTFAASPLKTGTGGEVKGRMMSNSHCSTGTLRQQVGDYCPFFWELVNTLQSGPSSLEYPPCGCCLAGSTQRRTGRQCGGGVGAFAWRVRRWWRGSSPPLTSHTWLPWSK